MGMWTNFVFLQFFCSSVQVLNKTHLRPCHLIFEYPMNPLVHAYVQLSRGLLSSEPSDIEYLLHPTDKNQCSILWRSQYEELRVILDKILQKEGPKKHDRVFSGPAGAGKSCLLYSLAQYARTMLVLWLSY